MRVVIADDHAVVREGIRWMLETESEVDILAEVGNGCELVHILESQADAVDVVLLDLRMPDMTGFDVLEVAGDLAPNARMLVLSMHDEPAFVRRAFELGASGYLLKNTDRVELMDALRRVYAGLRYVNADTGTALIPGTEPEPSNLSPREHEIVQLIADGLENKQIARELELSEATVKSYLKSAFTRLGVSSRAEAVAVAMRSGIID
jgi:DNA-binding NarL/FixJ family response regulator